MRRNRLRSKEAIRLLATHLQPVQAKSVRRPWSRWEADIATSGVSICMILGVLYDSHPKLQGACEATESKGLSY